MIATMVVEWQAKCLTSNLVSEPKNNVKSHNVCVLCCRCHQKNAFLDTAAKTLTATLTVGYNKGDEKTTEDDDDDNNNNKKELQCLELLEQTHKSKASRERDEFLSLFPILQMRRERNGGVW